MLLILDLAENQLSDIIVSHRLVIGQKEDLMTKLLCAEVLCDCRLFFTLDLLAFVKRLFFFRRANGCMVTLCDVHSTDWVYTSSVGPYLVAQMRGQRR